MRGEGRLCKPGEGRRFDWVKARRLLEEFRASLESKEAMSREERLNTLKRRAKSLARRPEMEVSVGESCIRILEFLLASERYGIELSAVREVSPLRELTRVPCTPPFILGIINVRGRILSVIDIRVIYDFPVGDLTEPSKVIILSGGDMEFGILADAILGVRSIPEADIQPPLTTLSGMRAEYLRGVTGDRLAVLDAVKMLTDDRMVINEEVTE